MYKIDFNNKIHVHFIGIGGISMSGLAEILLGAGFTISGSDRDSSDLTKHLEALGATVNYPQAAANITEDIDLIVYTAAIREDNPEFAAHNCRFEVFGLVMHSSKCFFRSICISIQSLLPFVIRYVYTALGTFSFNFPEVKFVSAFRTGSCHNKPTLSK